MIALIGYAGLALLVGSYVLLLTRWQRYFFIVDAVASTVLTLYAVLIQDVIFTIVNGFIAAVLYRKAWTQQGGTIIDSKE